MQAYLVHHASAVGPEVDPQRPLSALGQAQAAWLAEQVRSAGFQPVRIWHSGKLRARQTADAIRRACSPSAAFTMVRGLQPGDPPDWMGDALEAETDDVLVVGHWPHLPSLLARLAPQAEPFPMNGLVALERAADSSWTELWRAKP
jgi:phosphohistidine phosphatase